MCEGGQVWGHARRRGRAREILAFLGKKIGQLYFCAKVVSTFPLALFDHFQKFTCAEEASRRSSQGGGRPFLLFFLIGNRHTYLKIVAAARAK